MANLPHDAIFDILSRLPVKSLCRFRCVSKLWRSLISDPHFSKTHLNRNNHHNERLILMSLSLSLYTVEHQEKSSDNGAIAVELDFPGVESPNDWFKILGSCNGLLLVAARSDKYFLLNPSTREAKVLPNSPYMAKSYDSFNLYGLGYDSCIDDYKVVNIFCHYSERVCLEIIVSVYTLGTGSWRRIEDSPYDHSFCDHSPGMLLNGALHWLVCGHRGLDSMGTIASLDLVDEKFRDLSPPSFGERIASQSLGVLGGCLCVLAFIDGYHYDVSVMEEYGVKESWVTKFSITISSFYVKLFCFPKSGEILIENGKNLVLHNPNEGTYQDVVIRGIPSLSGVGTYVVSLVSPNYRS